MLFNKQKQMTISGIRWVISYIKDTEGKYYEGAGFFPNCTLFIEDDSKDELIKCMREETDYQLLRIKKNKHIVL